MSRLDLLVLFIFAFFHCIQSSLSQHADIDTDNASNNESSDSNIKFSNSEYFEDDSILLPGDANASGIVPGKLPNDIINPSSDCVEEGAGSSEGKVAVENEDAIAISDGGDVKLGKKNITKESKTKRPCKTAHKADHDKQRGNRNDTSNGTFTSLKDPDDDSPGGMNMTGIIAISVSVLLVVMAVVVVVVVRYKKIDVVVKCRWKKSDKDTGDVELGNQVDSPGTELSPDDSSTQLLSKDIAKNPENGEAENDETASIAGPERQLSNDEFLSLPYSDEPLSLYFDANDYKSNAGVQRQFSDASYKTVDEYGPTSITSNASFKSTIEELPTPSSSVESLENDAKDSFKLKIGSDAMKKKKGKTKPAPLSPIKETTNTEESGGSGMLDRIKSYFK